MISSTLFNDFLAVIFFIFLELSTRTFYKLNKKRRLWSPFSVSSLQRYEPEGLDFLCCSSLAGSINWLFFFSVSIGKCIWKHSFNQVIGKGWSQDEQNLTWARIIWNGTCARFIYHGTEYTWLYPPYISTMPMYKICPFDVMWYFASIANHTLHVHH